MGKFARLLAVLGPGIFAIGYTIGTGSVTSMATAGSQHGLGLLWVLALSCLFSGVLMEAYGRMAAVTGETSLMAVKRHLRGGKVLSWLLFGAIVLGQYTCLGGILKISSGAIGEALQMYFPQVPAASRGLLVGIAAAIMFAMYALLLIGRINFFEKLLAFFVAVMGLTFIVSIFVVWPDGATLARASVPLIPADADTLMMMAAFVGTTMAAPTFVTRPLLVREQGLTASAKDLRAQRLDAIVSATLMFVISGAIMFVATGALFAHGRGIEKVLDMAGALEPLAGRFAVAFFMVGTLSAGLSSIFPILMVAPLLLGDYRSGKTDTRSGLFRGICLAASIYAVVFTLIDFNPVVVTIAAQIANVFALPLAVFVIWRLVNRRDIMGEHAAGPALNVQLALALLFALVSVGAGVISLWSKFVR